MTTTIAATAGTALTAKASLAMQAALAMLLGGLILGVVGFSHVEIIHNAGHDTRHASGFPCH